MQHDDRVKIGLLLSERNAISRSSLDLRIGKATLPRELEIMLSPCAGGLGGVRSWEGECSVSLRLKERERRVDLNY